MNRKTIAFLFLAACVLASSGARAAVTVTETFFPDETGQIDVRLTVPATPLDLSIALLSASAGEEGAAFNQSLIGFLSGQTIDPYGSPALGFLKSFANALLGNIYTAPLEGSDPQAYCQSLKATKDGTNYVIDAVFISPKITSVGQNSGVLTSMTQTDEGGYTINVSVSLPAGSVMAAQDMRTLLATNFDQSLNTALGIISPKAAQGVIDSASVTPIRPMLDSVADALATVEYIMVMPGPVTSSRGTRSEGRRAYWNVNLNNIISGGTLEFSGTCGPPGPELGSEQALLASAIDSASQAYQSRVASAAAVESATAAIPGEPTLFVTDEAAYSANVGYGYLRNQQFQEALQAYDNARTLNDKYNWAYTMAKHMAEHANTGIANLGKLKPFPDKPTMGEHFGWEQPTLTGPATFSPEAYQEYLRQQREWMRANPGAGPPPGAAPPPVPGR